MESKSIENLANHSPRSRLIELAKEIPQSRVNPPEDVILDWVSHKRIDNQKDLRIFHSKITSRSASFTEVMKDDGDIELLTEIDQLFDHMEEEELMMMKMQVGQDDDVKLLATTILPKSHANKALMLRQNFYLSDHDIEESDIISVDIPTFPKRQVIVDPRPGERVTYVFGIDYYGEQKMSILRMVMEIMRQDRGGLGLHAGSKTYHLKENDKIVKKGMIIFGLSGTGKTTLTCHDHGFDKPEGVDILQDDITLITADGSAYGSEYGFYVKTADAPEHELITNAILSPGSVLENVAVNPDGTIAWKDFSHTYNGRCIVPRHALNGAAEDIDLPQLDVILFNTRRPELPPIGRLVSEEQAAAYYALGESIITSAETKDPTLVGKAKRVVGFDPFILGNEEKNIHRVRDILKMNPETKCFVVNTGYVGSEENNIGVEETLACIEQMLRDEIEWVMDENLGYEIPKYVEGIEWENFVPSKYFGKEKFANMMADLREERRNHLSQFENLDEEIINSL